MVHEVAQVVACQRVVVIKLSIPALRRGPALPRVLLVEGVAAALPVELRFVGPILLESIEILEEQKPRRLLGVVELRGATASLRRTSSMFRKACSNIEVKHSDVLGYPR